MGAKQHNTQNMYLTSLDFDLQFIKAAEHTVFKCIVLQWIIAQVNTLLPDITKYTDRETLQMFLFCFFAPLSFHSSLHRVGSSTEHDTPTTWSGSGMRSDWFG